ncbi:hypothetical protein COC42_01765 [Sphingomonas spermidinifaciens]|uniref:Uncharacterized protein n=1 Tax=Sphingomonas spermidinifaciens TaxID=1141889 RepID=A0A2A4B1V4_9SPHN|nr:hypothetical protein [Sphingomonas spermidinifaciens]PCD03173.1 hypothetical protein COC42_01765 [Sphingomonas spermidinifaciens]
MLGILPAGCDAVDANSGAMATPDRAAALFALLDLASEADPLAALADSCSRCRASQDWGRRLAALPGQGWRIEDRTGDWRTIVTYSASPRSHQRPRPDRAAHELTLNRGPRLRIIGFEDRAWN